MVHGEVHREDAGDTEQGGAIGKTMIVPELSEYARVITDSMGRVNGALPILAMTASIVLAFASALAPREYYSLLAMTALSIGLLGAVSEIFILNLMLASVDLSRGVEPRLYSNIVKASVAVSLFFTVVGSLILKRILESSVEIVTGRHVQESCPPPSSLLTVASLGYALGLFQQCVVLSIRNYLLESIRYENAVGLGA